jgi:hypothetical protein
VWLARGYNHETGGTAHDRRRAGPILASRVRHSAELGPDGLGAGGEVPGCPAWGLGLIYGCHELLTVRRQRT